MSVLRNLPISRKIACAFGAACMLCVLLGATAWTGLLKVGAAIHDIAAVTAPSTKELGDIRYSLATIRRSDALLLLCDSAACTTRLANKRKVYIESYNLSIEHYAALVSKAEQQQLYQTIRQNGSAYIAWSEKSRSLADSGNLADATKLLLTGDAVKSYNAAADAVEASVAMNARRAVDEGIQSTGLVHSLLIAVCSVLGITILLCAAIGVTLARLIVVPLTAVTAALEQVARKNLNVTVAVHSSDETGRLSEALNSTVDSIRHVLTSVGKGVTTLSSAAEKLSIRSAETSGNSQAQASKINQIAAAAQQMTATIGEISHNAEVASGASRESAETARRGGSVMDSAATSMEQIAASSRSVEQKMASLAQRSEEIGKVVGVIQQISGQTNLLALNAAIEAARAGEHGRGFAVVAGEVRRLAERTKGATEEIAGAIRSIQQETRETLDVMMLSRTSVEAGLGETVTARNSLEAIIGVSAEVQGQIQMIATAATEQTSASGEISESASQISNLAAENSHAAEEAAAACKNLSALASDLDGLICEFNVCVADSSPPRS
jgi:methyl-accepting chemotaxis protein